MNIELRTHNVQVWGMSNCSLFAWKMMIKICLCVFTRGAGVLIISWNVLHLFYPINENRYLLTRCHWHHVNWVYIRVAGHAHRFLVVMPITASSVVPVFRPHGIDLIRNLCSTKWICHFWLTFETFIFKHKSWFSKMIYNLKPTTLVIHLFKCS